MPFRAHKSASPTSGRSSTLASVALNDGRELVVRQGRARDARAVRDLIAAVAAEPSVPLLTTPQAMTTERVRGYIMGARAGGRGLFLVGEVDGAVVGNIGGHGLDIEPSRHVLEIGMSVAAAARGVGVGSALLDAALAWAAVAGYQKVVLSVFPHNERAIALYERHGFVREGVRARQFVREGRYLDEVLMARWLGPADSASAGAGSSPADES
ncbi:MAG TPA: GNAT family protein [Thermoleophilia bacterium]|nr:GNAT family protein [Thermoleophilia bacterium]